MANKVKKKLKKGRAVGVEIAPEIQLRILNFVNNMRRPSDLMQKRGLKITKETAKRILEKRAKMGAFGFRTIEDLLAIDPDLLKDLVIIFGPAFYGQWAVPYDTQLPDGTPVSVAHAALLHTGKVLFLPEFSPPVMGINSYLWDPSDEVNPVFSLPDNQPTDNLFCSGHSFLSDGKLLVAGGDAVINRGWKFDPDAGKNGVWTQTGGNMAYGRYYPTVVTLGDERRVFVVGGLLGGLRNTAAKPEIYDEFTDDFEEVTLPVDYPFPELYPGLHLLPGGEIFYSRTGFASGGSGPGGSYNPQPKNLFFRFENATQGEWIQLDNEMNHVDRVRGMSVLLLDRCYPNVRVLVIGGDDGGENAEITNLSTLTPEWEEPTLIPGGEERRNVNAVLLPDNTVFVCGGTATADPPCALYDPSANTWSEMERLNYVKRYHSVALLLPSGKVMATGGAAASGSMAIEIFSPPYLFRGARPVITSAPDLVHHADEFDLETPQAAEIRKVVLVRPMAVTHQTDTEQRVIQMDFTVSGTTLQVTAPDHEHPHLAPRGYYMLFILNNDGVPSVGRFIFLH